MKAFWKWIAGIAFYSVAIGLIAYAASRSLDFITATLPADQQILGYLGLLATSGGSLAWLAVYLYHAQGTGQKGLSMLLVIADLLGEFALFTFDTLYRTGEAGMTSALAPEEIRLVVLALSGLIALNIGGTIAFHLLDPETSKRMREESARDILDGEVLKAIENRAPQIAEQIAPQIAAQWEADFTRRFSDMAALGIGKITSQPSLPAPDHSAPPPARMEAPEKPRLAALLPPEAYINLGKMNGYLEGYDAAKGNGNGSKPYPVRPAHPLPGEGESE